MTTKVGINGFGRIGRQVLKALRQYYADDIQVVAVNDLFDAKTNAHLFKYDSTYGTYPGTVEVSDGDLVVDGDRIKVLAEKDPRNLKWGSLGVEIVVESTGVFTDAKAKGDKAGASVHIEFGGAKKVIITAPAKNEDLTLVLGVNDAMYDPAKHHVLSNASCTTNCLAPAAKVVHDELRIPTATVSLVDFVAEVERATTVADMNAAFRAASVGELEGILGYTEEPLVSSDFRGDTRSSIIDGLSTMVLGGTMVKIIAWYDNEWGYSVRTA